MMVVPLWVPPVVVAVVVVVAVGQPFLQKLVYEGEFVFCE